MDTNPQALRAALAIAPDDRALALGLRARVFRQGAPDDDDQDAACQHVLITRGGAAACTLRLRTYEDAGQIAQGYAGRRYDLSRLAGRAGPLVEVGRFCTAPGTSDPEVVRLAWACLAQLVLAGRAHFLFGCASFAGTEPAAHAPALAWLATHSLAPPDWAPAPAAGAETHRFRHAPPPADPVAARAGLPPLLRSYLALGGRVSDHAVIDRDLGTLHLFTGLDLARLPEARAETLRQMARAAPHLGGLTLARP